MLVDYKNHTVHNFTKYESDIIIATIDSFEETMHKIQLGRVKKNISVGK